MLELLAPAGSMEALRAAVQNGADAVYLGCGAFNARQGAKNFTPQLLEEAVKYCHVRGVAVHLALNTLVSDREIRAVCELIEQGAKAGVDAFIVQDLGVLELCHQIAPWVPIHGSTQLTVHNLPGVQLCATLGMRRVVLSRELSREEIGFICRNTPLEIEVFAHGALCMCYSGQCYLSAAIGGRSGNRGRCAQPCRQSYGFGHADNRYPLSLKDNCLIPYLKELEQLGVTSIKLEGRMKRPEYVASVTKTYRQAMEQGGVTRPMLQELTAAFNRQGFTDGYYTGLLGPHMFGIREDVPEDKQWLERARQSYESMERSLVPVRFTVQVNPAGSSLTVTDPQERSFTAQGSRPEPARSRELTAQDLAARLAKTGGTPYRCVNVRAEVAPGLMLSAAAINAMRRDALNGLTVLRARRENRRTIRPAKTQVVRGRRIPPGLTVQVTSLEQITRRMLQMRPTRLYVPMHLVIQEQERFKALTDQVRVTAVLPRIVHDAELTDLGIQLLLLPRLGIQEVLVGNLGLLAAVRELGLDARGDFGLNLFNSHAMHTARDLELRSATLSFEMSLPQIRDISKPLDTEMLVYGRMPLMVTENCIIKNKTGGCTCRQGTVKLVDRTGAEFPVIRDGNACRSVLLNGKKLYMLDRLSELQQLGLWATRLYFTTESPQEVDRILDAYRNQRPFDPGACTRGLYFRGVE